MFDPSVGRWLQVDPSFFEGGDANLYRYVGNDPTNASDSSGLQAEYVKDDGGKPVTATLKGLAKDGTIRFRDGKLRIQVATDVTLTVAEKDTFSGEMKEETRRDKYIKIQATSMAPGPITKDVDFLQFVTESDVVPAKGFEADPGYRSDQIGFNGEPIFRWCARSGHKEAHCDVPQLRKDGTPFYSAVISRGSSVFALDAPGKLSDTGLRSRSFKLSTFIVDRKTKTVLYQVDWSLTEAWMDKKWVRTYSDVKGDVPKSLPEYLTGKKLLIGYKTRDKKTGNISDKVEVDNPLYKPKE